jgi:hypothetical protein
LLALMPWWFPGDTNHHQCPHHHHGKRLTAHESCWASQPGMVKTAHLARHRADWPRLCRVLRWRKSPPVLDLTGYAEAKAPSVLHGEAIGRSYFSPCKLFC